MAAEKTTMKVNIVAADHPVWHGEATSVTIPASEGGMGILPDHEPVLTVIKQGTLTVVEPDGDRHMFEVTDGFINAAVTFDFHSHMLALGIHGHNIHWANGGRVFATHQLGSLADTLDLLGQIALQMVFHAILDETRIFAQIIGLVGIDMLQRHFKNVRTLVGADT